MHDTPNAKLKHLAADLGVRMKDLLVLATQNDPFNSGTKTQRRMAEWFANIVPTTGVVHLRQLHYAHDSKPGATLWDGTPYENTKRCWQKLQTASKHARYLGLVDPDRIVDRRNPSPIVFAEALETDDGYEDVVTTHEWQLPEIDAYALDAYLPRPRATLPPSWYEYTAARQPLLVEVWIEKSTMNDLLRPVCQAHGVNLVTAVGYQSITGAKNLLKRAADHDKDAVVLYISDFDPAGQKMPAAVARQFEYHAMQFGTTQRVLLNPIALTLDQVAQYRLPRKPFDENSKDRRRANFENACGAGYVELDALEALHPGALSGIVEAAILEHRDPDLDAEYQHTQAEADALFAGAQDVVLTRHSGELGALEGAIRETAAAYQAELTALAERLEAEMAPHEAHAERLQQAITTDLREAIDLLPLPSLPQPELPTIDPSAYLFDSHRGYLEQLAVYKQRAANAASAGGEDDAA